MEPLFFTGLVTPPIHFGRVLLYVIVPSSQSCKCIGRVTNPMKNHSSMILPLLSISYLYGQTKL